MFHKAWSTTINLTNTHSAKNVQSFSLHTKLLEMYSGTKGFDSGILDIYTNKHNTVLLDC